MIVWTHDRVELLRAFAASPDKPTAAEIAQHFDVTRNAVIGLCRRHDIALQNKRCAARGDKPKANNRRRQSMRLRSKTTAPAVTVDLRADPVTPLGIQFLDLEPHHCRYAYGDAPPYTFCGHATHDNSSFCPAHTALCWVAPVARTKRAAA